MFESDFVTPAQHLLSDVTALQALAARVSAQVAAGALREVAPICLPEVVVSLAAAGDAVEAVRVHAVGRVHTTKILWEGGERSTRSWLNRTTRCSSRRASITLARAHAMTTTYPTVGAAHLTGAATPDQAGEICLGLDRIMRRVPAPIRDEVLAYATEALLILAAAGATPEDLTAAADKIALVTDQNGASKSQLDAHLDQSYTSIRVGDRIKINAWLDLDAGAALDTCLDQIVTTWHRTGQTTPEPAIDPTTGLVLPPAAVDPDDPDAVEAATIAEALAQGTRRPVWLALALGHLARHFLDNGNAGSTRAGRPHLTYTGTLADLTDYLTAATNAETAAAAANDWERRGTGASGALHHPGTDHPISVPTATLARIGCDADLTLILTDALTDTPTDATAVTEPASSDWKTRATTALQDRTQAILWIGRTQRTVTRRQWAALVHRDHHCQYPNCRADPTRCDAHHVRWWRNAGTTNPDNLILLCQRHHHHVHEGGWTITASTNKNPLAPGYFTFTPPPRRRH